MCLSFIYNNIPIEKGPKIEYMYNNKRHYTYIDFEIDDTLFEVKGGHLLQGIYDYEGVPIDEKLKVYQKYSVVVITNESAFSKLNALKHIDIKLFENKANDWNMIKDRIKD